ncbi:MAG: 6,7-dimethyl-8-ribityllumazine synthase [Saprospiraceae bacterium]|nr:6,7-dimethyl-8-ribityllumazine synthase [Saprospiraceae bacterium]
MAGKLPSARNKSISISLSSKEKIGIVVSDWNDEITSSLVSAARKVLELSNLQKNLIIVHVPGAFELPFAASLLCKKKNIKGVICLGCVIKGQTKHDDYINNTIANAFSQLAIDYSKPVIFGVLTTNNIKQARERSGGKLGNKGEETAIALLKMLQIQELISNI